MSTSDRAAKGIREPKDVQKLYFNIAMQQYDYGRNDPDFIDRVGVFGSSGFTISSDTVYTVNSTGSSGSFSSMRVLPFDDNFDFNSGNPATQLSNGITGSEWRGETLFFTFTNKGAVLLSGAAGTYGVAQLSADQITLENSRNPVGSWDAQQAFWATMTEVFPFNQARSERAYASFMRSIGAGNLAGTKSGEAVRDYFVPNALDFSWRRSNPSSSLWL